nr:hypothetical protein CFP56_21239 [Quercus suber]
MSRIVRLKNVKHRQKYWKEEWLTAHREAAASIAPAPLKAPGLVISIDTGYFHVINLAQPTEGHKSALSRHNPSQPIRE